MDAILHSCILHFWPFGLITVSRFICAEIADLLTKIQSRTILPRSGGSQLIPPAILLYIPGHALSAGVSKHCTRTFDALAALNHYI